MVFGAVHADLPEVIHHPDGVEAGLVRGARNFPERAPELGRAGRPGEIRDGESDLHCSSYGWDVLLHDAAQGRKFAPAERVEARTSGKSMKPVLGIRNDRDDTLGITAAVLAEAGVQLTRLDAFEADVRWPELEEIGGLMVRVTDVGQRDALLTPIRRAPGATDRDLAHACSPPAPAG